MRLAARAAACALDTARVAARRACAFASASARAPVRASASARPLAAVCVRVFACVCALVARCASACVRAPAHIRPHDKRRLEAARFRVQLLHGEAGVLGQVGQREGLPAHEACLHGPLRVKRQKPAFRAAFPPCCNRAGKRQARLVGQRDAEGELPRAVGGGDLRRLSSRRQLL